MNDETATEPRELHPVSFGSQNIKKDQRPLDPDAVPQAQQKGNPEGTAPTDASVEEVDDESASRAPADESAGEVVHAESTTPDKTRAVWCGVEYTDGLGITHLVDEVTCPDCIAKLEGPVLTAPDEPKPPAHNHVTRDIKKKGQCPRCDFDRDAKS